eukprot:PhM_4_TR7840/c0_g1_i1/m.62810
MALVLELLERGVAVVRLPDLVVDTLYLQLEHLVLLDELVEHLLQLLNLELELALLLLGALPLRTVDLALHLLHLELDVVEKLLLLEALLVELVDLGEHVVVLGLSTADLGEKGCLLPPHVEELLRGLVLLFLELRHFLVECFHALLRLVEQLGDELVLRLELFGRRHLFRELVLHLVVLRLKPRELALPRLELLRQRVLLGVEHVHRRDGLRQGVLDDLHLVLELLQRGVELRELPAVLREDTLLLLDAVLGVLVVLQLERVELGAGLQLVRSLLLPLLALGVTLLRLLDGLVAAVHGLHSLIPLVKEVLPLTVQLLVVLGRFVELDLRGLRQRDLVLEVVALRLDLVRKLFDL